MAQISVQGLTFAYDGSYDNIFENASFSIDTDWKLGFIGRNGRGKTTFMRLLQGKYVYSGSISAPHEFDYFPFDISDDSLPALEAVQLARPECEEWQLLCELSLLEVEESALERPLSTLSGGERTKLMLAALFASGEKFLLIDEPTDHLDLTGRRIVSQYLNRKKGFILVSHDRAFLDGCVDHVLSIERAKITVQAGNFSSWYHNKQLEDEFELEKNSRLKREIKRLEQTAREKANWSDKVEATKIGSHAADRGFVGKEAALMMRKSKAIETRVQREIEEKTKLLKNIEKSDSLKVNQLRHFAERLITIENVSIFYGEKRACKDVNLTVERGERVALTGRNGSGKSSVLKLICGQPLVFTGECKLASGLEVSYVSQDTGHLAGNLADFAEENGLDESLFKAILRKLDFARVQFDKDIRDFSSGQKKKVLIARSLCERTHLLIWDEPLNFIDVISRMQIEDLLMEYTPSILFVEHDAAFCGKIATKTVELG